jgi:hypothetical protein
MLTLSPEKLLAVWEAGREQHELDRALSLLGAGTPGVSRAELASLTIGERDARLLRMRAQLFGTRAEGFAECPECSARVEFPIDTALFESPTPSTATDHAFACAGRPIRFRSATTLDLAEVVAADDAAAGLRRLVEQCVLEGPNRSPFYSGDLSPETVDTLGDAMLAADPQSEITLALSCPECGHAWMLLFDVADFLWNELAAQARRLLHEVDVLARAYGWSEHEILSLSPQRRQSYLETIGE